MRIQTRGNSTTVWLSSNEGVIISTMLLSAPTLEKILQAVNEKYGTSFEGWSQLPAVYVVGNTVPNWDAYEKIELILPNLMKTPIGGGGWVFGEIISDVWQIKVRESLKTWVGIYDGSISLNPGPTVQQIENVLRQRLDNAGLNETGITSTVVEYETGEIIPNWRNYTILPG